MRSRYYDPIMRAFLSQDPAEDDSLGNLYTAFENNPGIYKDPTGEVPVLALLGIAGVSGTISGVIDYGLQYWMTGGFETENYNPLQGSLAVTTGAISGPLGAYIGGTALSAKTAFYGLLFGEAAIGKAQEGIQSELEGRSYSLGKAGIDFVLNSTIGLFSEKASRWASKRIDVALGRWEKTLDFDFWDEFVKKKKLYHLGEKRGLDQKIDKLSLGNKVFKNVGKLTKKLGGDRYQAIEELTQGFLLSKKVKSIHFELNQIDQYLGDIEKGFFARSELKFILDQKNNLIEKTTFYKKGIKSNIDEAQRMLPNFEINMRKWKDEHFGF